MSAIWCRRRWWRGGAAVVLCASAWALQRPGDAALAAAGPGADASLSAQQIVDAMLQQNVFGFENAVARLTLKLLSSRGSERIRQVEVRSLREGDLSRTLVRFSAPADVAGTGFLLRETGEGPDEQYLYLPAIGKVKRISGEQRHQKFMGTDLTYADLESRSLRRAALKRLADADVGGNAVYVVEATPHNDVDSPYSKTVSWIHKTSFVPLLVEYYDLQGELTKTLRVRRLEKNAGRWVVAESLVHNERRHTSTEMRVESIDFSAKLTDSDFTKRALDNDG